MSSINRNQTRISIITAAILAVTGLVAYTAKGDSETTAFFWFALFPVLMAELMVCGSFFLAAGENRAKIVRRSALTVVPILYLVFTLVMAAVVNHFSSSFWYGILQAVGLVATLVLTSTSAMAAEASEVDEKKTRRSLETKKNWRLDLETAAEIAAKTFPKNPDIAKAMKDATEKARFSSETLSGHEDFDEPVHQAVQVLCQAANGENPETVLQAARDFQMVADLRNRRIRNAR